MHHAVKGALLFVVALITTASFPASVDNDVTPMQQMFIMKELKPDIQRLGIIWASAGSDEEKMLKIRRAGTSLKMQLFLAEIGGLSDIAPQFRTLKQTHNIQALWIVENDGLVDSSTGKGFLIKNALQAGIPIFAPSEDWVNAGACATMTKKDGGIHLVVNETAAKALSISVPEKYLERTQFLASN